MGVRSHEMQQASIWVHREWKSVFRIETTAAAETESKPIKSTAIINI